MVKEFIDKVYIPSSANIVHQLDRRAVAQHAGVVEDLLAHPVVRTRISDSVVELMMSDLRRALRPRKYQYNYRRIPIKDSQLDTSMRNLVVESLSRAMTSDHTI